MELNWKEARTAFPCSSAGRQKMLWEDINSFFLLDLWPFPPIRLFKGKFAFHSLTETICLSLVYLFISNIICKMLTSLPALLWCYLCVLLWECNNVMKKNDVKMMWVHKMELTKCNKSLLGWRAVLHVQWNTSALHNRLCNIWQSLVFQCCFQSG